MRSRTNAFLRIKETKITIDRISRGGRGRPPANQTYADVIQGRESRDPPRKNETNHIRRTQKNLPLPGGETPHIGNHVGRSVVAVAVIRDRNTFAKIYRKSLPAHAALEENAVATEIEPIQPLDRSVYPTFAYNPFTAPYPAVEIQNAEFNRVFRSEA